MGKTVLSHLEKQIEELHIACHEKCEELFRAGDGSIRETLDAKQWEKVVCHQAEYLINSITVESVNRRTDTNAPYMYLKVMFEDESWQGVRIYLPDAVEA